jgi:4,5-dihydroxyphthalate decarboxylase
MAPTSDRSNVRLTMALSDYDHVRDLVSGRVPVAGVDLTCLTFEVEEIFFRFTRHREWEVSELSLAKYCALRGRDDDSVVAIPVFPSRSFRHAALYVRPDGPVDDPGALRGGRIGIPEWTITAVVWGRGVLAEEHGVALTDVEWVQGGTNEPGRIETLAVEVPDGVRVRAVPDAALNDLLIAGELDAILAPHAPDGFTDGSGRIVRLFSDHRAVEEDYYRRTGVFPIMHVVVLRADVHAAHPWIAGNLVTAFTEAKERSLQRALDTNAPSFPVPWGPAHARWTTELFGADPWPYGIDANRVTLDAFLRFAHEQGVCARRLDVEKLFAPEVREAFRV